MTSSFSRTQQAAVVLLALDEPLAAELMGNLEPTDVRDLVNAIQGIDPVPADSLKPALDQFEKAMAGPIAPTGGAAYLRQLASKTFGHERVKTMLTPDRQSPVDRLRETRDPVLAEILENEHPQLAAVVLSQLPKEQASRVLLCMREDHQADLLQRLAQIETIPTESLDAATQSLVDALADVSTLGGPEDTYDGVAFVASLMNELPMDDNERILEAIEDAEPELAPKIREAMFVFEDLMSLDDRSVQGLMREVQAETLLVALKSAPDELREKFFSAVSKRAAETMREDLELMPPRRLSEVEEAQRAIVEQAMELASQGKIMLGSREELV